jgi:hypothetical protein
MQYFFSISPFLAYKFSNPHVKIFKSSKAYVPYRQFFLNKCGGQQQKSVTDWLKFEVGNAFSAQSVQV